MAAVFLDLCLDQSKQIAHPMAHDYIPALPFIPKFGRNKPHDRTATIRDHTAKAVYRLDDPMLAARLMLESTDPADADETTWSIFCDMFWGRRSMLGVKRTEKEYKRAMYWQLLIAFPAFPPVAFIMLIINLVFRIRPRATRIVVLALFLFALLLFTAATNFAHSIEKAGGRLDAPSTVAVEF